MAFVIVSKNLKSGILIAHWNHVNLNFIFTFDLRFIRDVEAFTLWNVKIEDT